MARHWKVDQPVRFKSAVEKAVWTDDSIWTILESSLHETEARTQAKSHEYGFSCIYLISAVGQLHVAHVPKLLGSEHFFGRIVHSVFWDEDENLEGKKVAVIGNGATGVQIIPNIALRAKQLTVFQRSPSWIIPRNNQCLSEFQQIP